MCERFTQTKSQADLLAHFTADAHPTLPDLTPRYNVASSQTVVGARPGGRGCGDRLDAPVALMAAAAGVTGRRRLEAAGHARA